MGSPSEIAVSVMLYRYGASPDEPAMVRASEAAPTRISYSVPFQRGESVALPSDQGRRSLPPATTGHPKNQAKPSRVAPMIARRAVRAAAHKIAVSPLKEIRRTRRLGQNLSLRRWLLTSLLGETVPRGGPYGAQGNVQKTNTAASMIGSGESAASPVGTSSRKTFDSSAKSIV